MMNWVRRRRQTRADRTEDENIRRYTNSPMPALSQTLGNIVVEGSHRADAVTRLENALRVAR
jgi:hypothetical protein